jgi:hypothetical protein
MILTAEKPQYLGYNMSSAMLSTTDLTCTALGMKLGVRSNRLAMCCLSRDTAPGSPGVPANIPILYSDKSLQGVLQSLQENVR